MIRRSPNMVFTQGPLSLGKSFGHERSISTVTLFSDGDSGTPSLFVQAANPWYDIRDTYIVRFVADGCRKNLPLSVPRFLQCPNLVAAADTQSPSFPFRRLTKQT